MGAAAVRYARAPRLSAPLAPQGRGVASSLVAVAAMAPPCRRRRWARVGARTRRVATAAGATAVFSGSPGVPCQPAISAEG